MDFIRFYLNTLGLYRRVEEDVYAVLCQDVLLYLCLLSIMYFISI